MNNIKKWLPLSVLSLLLVSVTASAVGEMSEKAYCESQNYSDILLCAKFKNRAFYASEDFASFQRKRACEGVEGEPENVMRSDCATPLPELQKLFAAMYESVAAQK